MGNSVAQKESGMIHCKINKFEWLKLIWIHYRLIYFPFRHSKCTKKITRNIFLRWQDSLFIRSKSQGTGSHDQMLCWSW